MNKVYSNYVEKVYNIDKEHSISIISEVDSRDPEKVINDTRMNGFRFFDIDSELAMDGSELNNPNNRINQTKWILYGSRVSLDEAKILFPGQKELLANLDNEEDINDVLLTGNKTIIPMKDDMMTYNEYLGYKNKNIEEINKMSSLIDKMGKKDTVIVIMNFITNIPEKNIDERRNGYLLLQEIVSGNISLDAVKNIVLLLKLGEKNIPLDFILNEIDYLSEIYSSEDLESIVLTATNLGISNKMRLLKSYYFKEEKNDKQVKGKSKKRS